MLAVVLALAAALLPAAAPSAIDLPRPLFATQAKKQLPALRESAETSPAAALQLAEILLYGIPDVVPADPLAATSLLTAQAPHNHTAAMLRIALMSFVYLDEEAAFHAYQQLFDRAADDPDVAIEVRMALGYRHMYGIGTPQDWEAAARMYKIAASTVMQPLSGAMDAPDVVPRLSLYRPPPDDDHPDLETIEELERRVASADTPSTDDVYRAGRSYLHGDKGAERDVQRAGDLLDSAVHDGHPEAPHDLAILHLINQTGLPDVERARELFQEAIDRNSSAALNGLGFMYYSGQGVERDFATALELFSLSAATGNADGLFNVGLMYRAGKGVDRNRTIALDYFLQSAKAGHWKAPWMLGHMYYLGQGTDVDMERATRYYKKTAELGRSSSLLASAYDLFRRGQTHSALLRYIMAAELGFAVANANTAFLYAQDFCPDHHTIPRIDPLAPRDENEAQSLDDDLRFVRLLGVLQRASRQGNLDASLALGDAYFEGFETGDPAYYRAIQAYRRVRPRDWPQRVLIRAAHIYEHGLGVDKDPKTAQLLYRRAGQRSTSIESYAFSRYHLALLAVLDSDMMTHDDLQTIAIAILGLVGLGLALHGLLQTKPAPEEAA